MSPRANNSRKKVTKNGVDDSIEEVIGDIISIGDTSDASSSVKVTGSKRIPPKPRPMRGSRPATRGFIASGRGGYGSRRYREGVPDQFQDLVDETLSHVNPNAQPEDRPRKKRKVMSSVAASKKSVATTAEVDDDDDDVAFEDVLHANGQQTILGDTDEGSGASDAEWDQLKFDPPMTHDSDHEDLDLTLTSKDEPAKASTQSQKRKVLTKDDRAIRLSVHKMHLLCLITTIRRRNMWCSDEDIQRALLPLINKKILANLCPDKSLSQFRQTDLLTTALEQLIPVWNARFSVVTRGMKQPRWVEDEHRLKDYKLPEDAEGAMDKHDLLAVAKTLKSSRDVGVLLFCALLRAAGLEVRLICSLQVLAFGNTAHVASPLSVPSPLKANIPSSAPTTDDEAIDISRLSETQSKATNMPFSARRRLGHRYANSADFHHSVANPPLAAPPTPSPILPKRKFIKESPFPVFWVEVLDEAHQKWMPVDPLVTRSVNKPLKLEPPAADHENTLAYVLAFEDDGVVKDVTRRYAKALKSKTRKLRVDSGPQGTLWWARVMKFFRRDWHRDLDDLEEAELQKLAAREPMPKNIADFKDHPTYALERHLRQNEVLVDRHQVGTVPSGRSGKLEIVYRRSDVRVGRSADRWYRLGRDVKMGEHPVKIMPPKKKKPSEDPGLFLDEDDGDREDPGVGIYTLEQTELYIPPPVVHGRVPRNAYGNLDIYVQSMVPAGGTHIPFDDANKAARLLGVDYADAVTGFQFRGRKGTPVVNGIVAAIEYREAILAVIEGFRDERAREEEDLCARAALNVWKRFIVGLRIKQRVDGYAVEGEDDGNSMDLGHKASRDEDVHGRDDAGSHGVNDDNDDDEGMQSEEYDEAEFGGGFIPE